MNAGWAKAPSGGDLGYCCAPRWWVVMLCGVGVGLGSAPLSAEQRPLSAQELVSVAEVVVVGRVTNLALATVPGTFEGGFGNRDLIVDVTVRVDRTEKGDVTPGNSIVARGFRAKSRRSLTRMVGLGGHRPIPAEGTHVRAHVQARDGRWWLVYPNGLTAPDGQVPLADAPAMAAAQGRLYTYVLPIEVWVALVVAGLGGVAAYRLIKRWRAWWRGRSLSSRGGAR